MELLNIAFRLTAAGVAEANQALGGVTAAGERATGSLSATERASSALAGGSQRVAATTREAVGALAQSRTAARQAAQGYDEVAARAPFIARLTEAIARAQGVTRNAFAPLARDVQLATAAFRAGQISAQDYAVALATARQQALALSQQTGTLSGPGLGTFNRVLTQTEQRTQLTTHGFSQMERGLALLAGQALGANAGFERFATGLLLFGVGGPVTVVVLAGLAAIAGALHLAGEDARLAREEQDALVARLAKAAGPYQTLTDAVRAQALATERLADAQRRLRLLGQLGPPGLPDAARAAAGGAALGSLLGPIGTLAGALLALQQRAQALRREHEANAAVANAHRISLEELRRQLADMVDLLTRGIAAGDRDRETLENARRARQVLTREIQTGISAVTGERLAYEELVQKREQLAALDRAFAKDTKDATARAREESDALARRADLAVQNLRTQGASAERVAALRAVEQELTAALRDENRQRLESLGLLPQLIALVRAEAEARTALAAATEAVRPRALTFGLGGVTREEGRSLTAPLGEGLREGLDAAFGRAVFGGALRQFQDGLTLLVHGVAFHVRLVGAEIKDVIRERLGQQLAGAAQGALESIAAGIAAALGEVLAAGGNFGRAMLSTFGSAIASFGRALITFALQLKLALSALASLNPVAAIAIGFAMLALGSALGGLAKAAQQSFGGGAAGSPAPTEPIRVVMVDTSVRAASRVVQPAPTTYQFTVIGPSDPQAQRQIREIIRQADRRHLPSGI